mmetsp:Transcript_54225/g.80904  ORF Transcript_54225/g.80904 Transcript_54225/m.80904 type:complete len:279 (-) Transcript_54225:552-1388(-)
MHSLLDTDLVRSSFRNVTDPSLRMVSGLVVDTQKAHMDPTCSEHRNLKLGVDRGTTPRLGANRRHQVNFCVNVALRLSRESLDTPNDGLLLWFVLGPTKECLNLGPGCILRNRNLDDDMGGKQLIRKVGDDLEVNGHSRVTMFLLHCRNDTERKIDIVCDSISHQLELSIRRNKRNGTIRVKLSQTDTSMKGTIINLNTRLACTGLFTFNHQLIVQPELALRHTCQFSIHLDLTCHFVSKNRSCTRQEQVDRLQDVNVYFITLMFDSLTSPINRSSDL